MKRLTVYIILVSLLFQSPTGYTAPKRDLQQIKEVVEKITWIESHLKWDGAPSLNDEGDIEAQVYPETSEQYLERILGPGKKNWIVLNRLLDYLVTLLHHDGNKSLDTLQNTSFNSHERYLFLKYFSKFQEGDISPTSPRRKFEKACGKFSELMFVCVVVLACSSLFVLICQDSAVCPPGYTLEDASDEGDNTTARPRICSYKEIDSHSAPWGNITFANTNGTRTAKGEPIYGYVYNGSCLSTVLGVLGPVFLLSLIGYTSYACRARNQAIEFNSLLKKGSNDSSAQCLAELEEITGTPWIRKAVSTTLRKVFYRSLSASTDQLNLLVLSYVETSEFKNNPLRHYLKRDIRRRLKRYLIPLAPGEIDWVVH